MRIVRASQFSRTSRIILLVVASAATFLFSADPAGSAEADGSLYTKEQRRDLTDSLDAVSRPLGALDTAGEGLKSYYEFKSWYYGRRANLKIESTPIDFATGRLPEAAQKEITKDLVNGVNAGQTAKAIGKVTKYFSVTSNVVDAAEGLNKFGQSVADNGLNSPKPYATIIGFGMDGAVRCIPVVGLIVSAACAVSPRFDKAYHETIDHTAQWTAEFGDNIGAKAVNKYWDWKDQAARSRAADPPPARGVGSPLSPDPASRSGSITFSDGNDRTPPSTSADDLVGLGMFLGAVAQGVTGALANRPQAPAPMIGQGAPNPDRGIAVGPPAPVPSPRASIVRPPSGWVKCTCPDKHGGIGQRFNGELWHPDGPKCNPQHK